MAKYIGPKLKLSRREKFDLQLKSGIKNISEKCNFNQYPGQIHIRKSKISDYFIQLREKQKLKRIYGVLEKQFFNYYKKSLNSKFNTGEFLLQSLEIRLDNIIYRMGFSSTRNEAKQLINHKLIFVNNKIVNIPSYSLKKNDNIKISDKIINNDRILFSKSLYKNKEIVPWIKLYEKEYYGTLLYIPNRNEFNKDIDENLIIELYSK